MLWNKIVHFRFLCQWKTCQKNFLSLFPSVVQHLNRQYVCISRLQLQWLNKYYETIRRLVGPELDKQGLHEEKDWMLRNTEPFTEAGSSASVCSSSLTLIALVFALHNIIWGSPTITLLNRLALKSYPYAVSTEQLYQVDRCTKMYNFFLIKNCKIYLII